MKKKIHTVVVRREVDASRLHGFHMETRISVYRSNEKDLSDWCGKTFNRVSGASVIRSKRMQAKLAQQAQK